MKLTSELCMLIFRFFFNVIGWEWGVLQDQEKHSTEKAYERLLWSTVCGLQCHCFSLWWASPPFRADSRRGLRSRHIFVALLSLLMIFKQVCHALFYDLKIYLVAVGNGRWGWNRRHASSDRWFCCLNSVTMFLPYYE
jgi:hypothetical protein